MPEAKKAAPEESEEEDHDNGAKPVGGPDEVETTAKPPSVAPVSPTVPPGPASVTPAPPPVATGVHVHFDVDAPPASAPAPAVHAAGFFEKFQRSAPYIATVTVVAIGGLVLGAQGQVKKWAKEVVYNDFIENQEYHDKATKQVVASPDFKAGVATEVNQATGTE